LKGFTDRVVIIYNRNKREIRHPDLSSMAPEI
jgi:hypothetical protein